MWPKPDIAQAYHEQILSFLNARLTETYRFYVPIIAALTGFGLAWDRDDDVLLWGALFVAITLLVGTIAYIWTISYTYRNFQLTLEAIEDFLHLSQFNPGWSPSEKVEKPWKENRYWMVPELLKPIVMVLFTIAVLLALSFGLRFCTGIGGYPYCVTASLLLIVFVAILSCGTIHCMDRYYYHKLQENHHRRKTP